MMTVSKDNYANATPQSRWGRIEIAQKITEFKQHREKSLSQRQATNVIDVPRSTLQYWLERRKAIDHHPNVVNFFESPDGLAVLHQIMVATMFCMTQRQLTGNRGVSEFLKLSRLDRFVGSSYGSIQKIRVGMEEIIGQYGASEEERLAKEMPRKHITVCEDETFHPDICLVAIEPVSNYILAERYAKKRDAQSWNAIVENSLRGLNVNVMQSTSDEANGILKHVKENLNAHHSPDIFHVQQEISKATSGPLAAKIRSAEKELEAALEKNNLFCDSLTDVNSFSEFKKLEMYRQYQKEMRQANKNISQFYHPYDLTQGEEQTEEIVKGKLNLNFEAIKSLADSAGLGEASYSRINKAKRVVPKMLGTIVFFWSLVNCLLKSLRLNPELEQIMKKNVIPIFYLKEVARKSGSAKSREEIRVTVNNLTQRLQNDRCWTQLEKPQQKNLERAALQCAQFFQRSSSCVEGRNGQLSRYHHSLHALSQRTLRALTIIHNYHTKRPDGTTAAERFFESKPTDLFNTLLDKMDIPVRPAKSRKNCHQTEKLLIN